MGAGNNYVGSLKRQKKQSQAKYQIGRLFQQTSGTTLVQSDEIQKWVESVKKPIEWNQQTMICEQILERS